MKKYITTLLCLFGASLFAADVPTLNSNLEVVLPDGTVVGDVITATANTLQAVSDNVAPLVTLVELKAAVRLHVEVLNSKHAADVAALNAEKAQADAALQALTAKLEQAAALAAEAKTTEGRSGRGEKFKRLEEIDEKLAAALTVANAKAIDKEKAETENQIKALQKRLKTLKEQP